MAAKDITLKNKNGETRYPKSVTSLIFDNDTGETAKQQIDAINTNLTEIGSKFAQRIPLVNENGFFVIDSNGNVGMKYTEDGLDAGLLSSHFQSLIRAIVSTGISIFKTQEDGFFIVDEGGYIGFFVDANGAHAKNLVEYTN